MSRTGTGGADPDLVRAWGLLLQTAYGDKGGGIPENVLCARPRSPAGPVTTWGSLKLDYDPAVLAAAVDLFAGAGERFRDSETYRLDLVAFRVQVLSNEALAISARVDAALASRNRAAFEEAAGRFLETGRRTSAILDSEPFYRLASYEAQALRYGTTPGEKETSLRDAMMLITYWGGADRKSYDVNDYAYKAWAGMMLPYSLRRWEIFFDHERSAWDGKAGPEPDFYAWERAWVDEVCAAARPR